MTVTLRIVVIIASLFTALMILHKIRQSRLQIEDSVYWLGFAFILLLFSLFPAVPEFLSNLAGTYTTANFIYLAVIFLLMVKLFHMSIKLSQLETRIRDLTQEIAIDRHLREEEQKKQEKQTDEKNSGN